MRFATISVKFPEMTRKFSLAETDGIDLDTMMATSHEIPSKSLNTVVIKSIMDKEVTLETPTLDQKEIMLKIGTSIETKFQDDKTYIFDLLEIGDNKSEK